MDISGPSTAAGAPAASDFARLYRERSKTAGPRPFLTFYDTAAGGRVELSYTTFGNWLSKTANLVQDDLAAQQGDRIALAAAPHWLTAVWAVAPLLAGVVVDPWGPARGALAVAVGATDPAALAEGLDCPGDRFAISPDPMGHPLEAVPGGYRDFTTEVRMHGDQFAAYDPPNADTPALVVDGRTLTHRELIDAAMHKAAALAGPATGPGLRLLVDAAADRFSGHDLVRWLYAPLAVGGAVVLVRGADKAELDRIAGVEHTTAGLGLQ
ncbi:MAG TPA: TIGR03089 family protein [Actinocrinis sp.]